jgi:hypothetical protein
MFGKLFGKKGISLFELGKGYSFIYHKVEWEVLEVHNYKWGEDEKTIEYKVIGYGQEGYLEVENDEGEISCSFSVELEKKELSPDFSREDFEGENVLEELEYKGTRYRLDEIDEGEFSNITNSESGDKVTCYTYIDGKYFICIDQWEDGSMEYFAGEEIKTKDISKIKK